MRKNRPIGVLPLALLLICLVGALSLCACSSSKSSTSEKPVSEDPKYTVQIYVNCEKNLFFSRYDVDVNVDGTEIGNVDHGSDGTFEVSLTKGQHELVLEEEGRTSPDGKTSFVVEGEGDKFSYKIRCTKDQIEIESIKEGAEGQSDGKAKEDDSAKAEAAKAVLSECKGKTAYEAYNAAKDTGYELRFLDSYEVDVTDSVKKASADSDAGKALVSAVDIKEAGWFSSASATFTLDYVDPSAKEKRDAEEAEKAKREQLVAELKSCEGQSAAHAYELVKDSGLEYKFKLPESIYGSDVTGDVGSDLYAGARERAVVAKASVDKGGSSVTFTLDRPLAITAEDNEDVARVLRTEVMTDPFLGEFAERYHGKNIEFDGYINAHFKHENKNTRFDYFIAAGSSDDSGMLFFFEDVNYYDFRWADNGPGSADNGLNCHFVAKVDKYDTALDTAPIIFLEPVQTSLR